MLRLSTARKVADIFWPEFREYDGAIVLARCPVPPPSARRGTLTEYERLHGHTHIQEVFRWDVPRVYDPDWDTDRPDAETPQFAAAWELAQQMGRMWLAKLSADFPASRFRVYVTKLDDPIIHFHRVREGEHPWFTDEEAAEAVANGNMVVLDTAQRGVSSNERAI